MTEKIDLAKLSSKEIIEKVRSGELDSCEYHSPGAYLKAMEQP